MVEPKSLSPQIDAALEPGSRRERAGMSRKCGLAATVAVGAVIGVVFMLGRGQASPKSNPSVEGEKGPTEAQIDLAVERGLQALRRMQTKAGCFVGDVGHKRQDDYMVYGTAEDQVRTGQGHVGVTALAGLAFLADGHLPDKSQHGAVVRRILSYLIRCCSGYAFITDSGTNMYSHAFAVLFLAEAYGMTGASDPEVADVLRRATHFIAESQNSYGAWRYAPYTSEADLSVTVCQVQALRAARNAGILVPQTVIDRVIAYVRESQIRGGRESGAFFYKIHGRSARTKTSFAVNAAAVTSLHAAGLYDEREYGAALRYVEEQYAEISREAPTHFYFWYGNYYAAQALHMEGGVRFQRYFARLATDLIARQRPDGTWCNDTGPGDAFATAVACLLLRIPRQYLPIFHH